MAHDGVGDAQHAIEFSNLSGISMEIDERVIAVGQTVDLISEFTLAPVVDVVDGAVALRDSGLDTLDDVRAGFLVDDGATKYSSS